MHQILPPGDNIDRFCVSRKERERGLTRIKDYVDVTIQELVEYTKKAKKLITSSSNSNVNQRMNRIITNSR